MLRTDLVSQAFWSDGQAFIPVRDNSGFRALWKEIHTRQAPNAEWFGEIVDRVTKLVCSCGEFLTTYVATNPPRYDDWPLWAWELHNAVNEKLGKVQISWRDCQVRWHPELAWSEPQPKIDRAVVVTSISPNPRDSAKQALSIESWHRMGLTVYSVNNTDEIKVMHGQYRGVQWIVNDDQGDGFYARPTQPINRLIAVASELDKPILLINSDIQMYGDQSAILRALDVGASLIGIRHNYTHTPGAATAEEWGLDAFLIWPDQAGRLRRVPYSVGRPMWDYWLAWELERLGRQVDWLTGPYFYHPAHAVNWSDSDCAKSHEHFAKHIATVNWELWRRSNPKGGDGG